MPRPGRQSSITVRSDGALGCVPELPRPYPAPQKGRGRRRREEAGGVHRRGDQQGRRGREPSPEGTSTRRRPQAPGAGQEQGGARGRAVSISRARFRTVRGTPAATCAASVRRRWVRLGGAHGQPGERDREGDEERGAGQVETGRVVRRSAPRRPSLARRSVSIACRMPRKAVPATVTTRTAACVRAGAQGSSRSRSAASSGAAVRPGESGAGRWPGGGPGQPHRARAERDDEEEDGQRGPPVDAVGRAAGAAHGERSHPGRSAGSARPGTAGRAPGPTPAPPGAAGPSVTPPPGAAPPRPPPHPTPVRRRRPARCPPRSVRSARSTDAAGAGPRRRWPPPIPPDRPAPSPAPRSCGPARVSRRPAAVRPGAGPGARRRSGCTGRERPAPAPAAATARRSPRSRVPRWGSRPWKTETGVTARDRGERDRRQWRVPWRAPRPPR